MAANPNRISIREGIVGGIVAPHVRFEGTAVQQPDGTARVAVRNGKQETFCGTWSADLWKKYRSLIDENNVFTLPVENPAGGEDIYGFDRSLAVTLDGHTWRNGGPGGCIHMSSMVQANPVEKKRFDVASTSLEKAMQEAVHRCSAEEYRQVTAP
jgi:hypothetical protein